jgi:cytosine/adenosine deaminase-related metal-dependent hydrolase
MGIGFQRWADTEQLNLDGAEPTSVTISAHDALEWTTVNAADAVGLDRRIGSLAPGKQADIMVIGGPGISQHPHLDPAGSVVFQTSPHDVRHVLVAGRFRKRDGVLVGVDQARWLADADSSAERVLARVEASGRQLPGTPPGAWEFLAQMTGAVATD